MTYEYRNIGTRRLEISNSGDLWNVRDVCDRRTVGEGSTKEEAVAALMSKINRQSKETNA